MRALKLSVAAAVLMASLAPTAAAQTPAQPAAPRASASLTPPADAPPPKTNPVGPYAVSVISEPSLGSHTVYRPADLSGFTGDKRLPIVAWGNGACSNAGLLFQNFLKQVASHGYLVIASGPMDAPMPSFSSGGGDGDIKPDASKGVAAGRTKDEDLIKAVDWAIAENGRAGSAYAGKINTDKIAVMGQSCGGLQATAVSADPRIDTVVIWNSGVFSAGAQPNATAMSGATKEQIAKFHAPVAYFPGGPSDLAYGNSKDDFSRVTTCSGFLRQHQCRPRRHLPPPGRRLVRRSRRRLARLAAQGERDRREILRRRGLHPVQEPALGSREEEHEVGGGRPPIRSVLVSIHDTS